MLRSSYLSPYPSPQHHTPPTSENTLLPPTTLRLVWMCVMSGRGHAAQLRTRLSDRDIGLLLALRELRLMTGQQIRRLFFPDGNQITQARKARAAVKRLAMLQLITRLTRRVGGVHAGSEGQVVGLTGLGHAVLDVGTDTRRRHRSVIETKLAFQAHMLAISDLHVQLVEQTRASEGDLLEFAAEPVCWRRFHGIGGQSVILKPDAYCRIGVGDFERSAFIEQDMATESLPTIGRKLSVYATYWRTGQEQQARGVFPKVWWLVPSVARLTAIGRTIQRIPAEARELFDVVLTADAASQLVQLPTEGGAQ